MEPVRLGELLVRRGAITDAERDAIVREQDRRARPFGALAEEMFGVSPTDVEHAWAEQFASVAERVDPADVEPDAEALGLIDRRQAWQFGVVPLRFDGPELVAATSPCYLARAMRFVGWRITNRCRFVICTREQLMSALAERYPLAGLETPPEEVFADVLAP